jgi:predicted TIM-barrel fold metal-dependent hydrolase
MKNTGPHGGKALSRREFLALGTLAAANSVLLAMPSGTAEKTDSLKEGFIDAHVHVWTSDTRRYPLAPNFRKEEMIPANFPPEELFAHTRPCGVKRIVLIQMSYYGWDNSYMLDMMQQHPGVFSGVARIEENRRVKEEMDRLAKKGVRGFRIVAGNQPPERWLNSEPMAAMWKCAADKGLAICLLMDPQYLPAVEAMCQKFPRTPVVIDHLARIGIDGRIRKQDVANLCRLAHNPGVRVKVSAFYALGRKKAPYLDLAPLIRRVLDSFGPQRLMWASDSPFQVMGGHNYRDSIDLIRQRIEFLSAGDRDWLLRRTAAEIFFL